MSRVFYKIATYVLMLYYKVVCFYTVKGRENIPETGGIVFAANHFSLNDPPFIGALLPRMLRCVAKKELFDHKILGWLIKRLGAVPVDRNASSVSTIKTIVKILKNGDSTLIFPEGSRTNKSIKNIKDGAIVIAAMAGVPIVPIAISGKYTLTGKLKVSIGKPIYYSKDDMRNSHECAMELIKLIYDMADGND